MRVIPSSPRRGTGAIVGKVGVGHDIAEQKRGQAELTRVANDLRLLIDTANAPIFGIDTSGFVNEWNRKAAAITGFSREEVMGKDLVSRFITPEYRTRSARCCRRRCRARRRPTSSSRSTRRMGSALRCF